jgi:predicted kinase
MTKLIIINGLPASGKSTLANRLSRGLDVPVFAKDDFKELIADTVGYTDHESTQNFGKASFSILFSVARKCLEKGMPVIIEGNFSLGEETKSFLSYIEKGNIDVREVLCYASPELLTQRFRERTKHSLRHPVHHTLGENELNAWIERSLGRDGKADALTSKVLEVDTTELTDEQYQSVLSFLN